MYEYILSIDVESKRRVANEGALLEISMTVHDVESTAFVNAATFRFTTKGPFTEGTLNWLKKEKILDMFVDKMKGGYSKSKNEEETLRMNAYVLKIQGMYPGVKTVLYPVAFDWAFLNYMFYTYVGDNPLGYNARDLDSYAEALYGVQGWEEEEYKLIEETHASMDYDKRRSLCRSVDAVDTIRDIQSHDSLYDACHQGIMICKVLKALEARDAPEEKEAASPNKRRKSPSESPTAAEETMEN